MVTTGATTTVAAASSPPRKAPMLSGWVSPITASTAAAIMVVRTPVRPIRSAGGRAIGRAAAGLDGDVGGDRG